MIELIRPPTSPAADHIEATLREMVVAFEVVEDPDADGPTLVDGLRRAAGEDEVRAFLAQLRHDLREWNRFQGDACYIEDDGTIC